MKLYKRMHLESWNRDIFFDRYLTIRNYAAKGYGEINVLKGVLVIIGVLGIWLKNYFPATPYWLSIILGIFLYIYFIIFGGIWDKLKLFQKEAEWSNRRNPSIQEIKKNTKR